MNVRVIGWNPQETFRYIRTDRGGLHRLVSNLTGRRFSTTGHLTPV